MRVDQFNYRGKFKLKNSDGSKVTYANHDVVVFNGKTFIASGSIVGKTPDLGEKAGWVSLSDNQVLYESNNEPFYAKVGDEWFNTSTGIKYKRIENDFNEFWVEI